MRKRGTEAIGGRLSLGAHHALLVEAYNRALAEHECPRYTGPMVALRTSEFANRFSLGLDEIAGGPLELLELGGYHDELFSEPMLGTLARLIRERLDRLEAARTPDSPAEVAESDRVASSPARSAARTSRAA